MKLARPVISSALCVFLLGLPAIPQSAAHAPSAPSQPPAHAPQPAPGQTAAPAQEGLTNIKVQVNEVLVPVTVTDEKGRFISNLDARDFRVLDEGRPQRIEFFSHKEKQPVVIGFLVDLSNDSRIHWKTYQEAIMELVWNLLPGDPLYQGYLISYANDAELLVNTTYDSEKLADEIRKMKPGGGAALFDALYTACTSRTLVKGEPYEPRRVVVIIGSGHDSASKKSLDQVLELAQRNLVTIYALSTMAFGFANEDKAVLERLTTETGGHVEYPLESPYKDVSGYLSNPQDAGNYALTVGTGGYAAEISQGIVNSVARIEGEITTQYVLRYIPDDDPDAKTKPFHRIKVEIPSLPTAKVFARKGYYPSDIIPQPPPVKR